MFGCPNTNPYDVVGCPHGRKIQVVLGSFSSFFYIQKTQPQPTRLDERGYGCKDSGNFYLYLTKWKNAVWLAPIFQVPKGRGEQNWGCCRQGWPCASTRISTTFSAPWWLSSSWLLGKPIFFRKILCPKYTHVLHVWNIYLHLALNYGNTWSIWDSIKPF